LSRVEQENTVDQHLHAHNAPHPHEALTTVQRFAATLAQHFQQRLRENLVALYVHGSVATGDFVAGKSDLDLLAVCRQPCSASDKEWIRAWFARQNPPSCLAGIDCSCLSQQAASLSTRKPHWDLIIRVRCHHGQCEVVPLETDEGYSLLDLALACERGQALLGPAPSVVLAELPRRWLLDACAAEVRRWCTWEVINDRSSAVLTACRAWLLLDTNRLASKTEAGKWVLSRSPTAASLIEAALAQRRGEGGPVLSNEETHLLCQQVLERLEQALREADGKPPEGEHV
jgi:Domain of unknown function (DUF4111)